MRLAGNAVSPLTNTTYLKLKSLHTILNASSNCDSCRNTTFGLSSSNISTMGTILGFQYSTVKLSLVIVSKH